MKTILSAAEKSGSVKRVVFTQAGAGLVDPDKGDTLGTGMDQVIDEYVNIDAHSAGLRPPIKSPHHAYCGAKAYCMQYLQERSGQFPFSIAQIIPGTVIGPSELVSTAADAKAHMDRMSKAILFNDMKPRYAFGFVHVDDCAAIHIEALDESKAPVDRIPKWFVAAATTEKKTLEEIWKGVGDVIEKEFGKEVEEGVFKIGRENLPINVPFRVDSALTENMLLDGKKMRGIDECVKIVAKWYLELVQRDVIV
jgi:nucleoside-diphosphate-sugar epimerase